IQPGGLIGLPSEVALLFDDRPSVVPVLTTDAACDFTLIGLASIIAVTAWRTNLKSSLASVHALRSSNTRFSQVPTRPHRLRMTFVTHSLCKPAMIATKVL